MPLDIKRIQVICFEVDDTLKKNVFSIVTLQ